MLVTSLLVLQRQIVHTTDVFSVKHCSKEHCATVPLLIVSSYHPSDQASNQ